MTQRSARTAVVLDTDIGSDVNDAMALALLLGTPEVDLIGISTVYGDTTLRARLAYRYATLAGRSIAVHAGLSEPASGRPVWWTGHEGSLHNDLDAEPITSADAVAFLVETVRSRPGQVHLVAIGPLTNIAAALDADPRFAADVAGLWIMGGAFEEDGEAEHNIRSDSTAARRVFASDLPIVVTGLEITGRITVNGERLAAVAAAGALGAALAADISQWWAYRDEHRNVPHDPVAVLSLTRPELFALSEPGTITVTEAGEHEGRTRFTAKAGGTTRIVTGLAGTDVSEAMLKGIRRAGTLDSVPLSGSGSATDAVAGTPSRPAGRAST
jgi:purine nucleosidase